MVEKELSDYLKQLLGFHLRMEVRRIENDHHLNVPDDMVETAQPALERLESVSEELRDEGVDPLVIALALVVRGEIMMLEGEPRHKCEILATAMEREAAHFRESLRMYFCNSTVHAIAGTDLS